MSTMTTDQAQQRWDDQIAQLQHAARVNERRAQVFDKLRATRLAAHTRALATEDQRTAERMRHCPHNPRRHPNRETVRPDIYGETGKGGDGR